MPDQCQIFLSRPQVVASLNRANRTFSGSPQLSDMTTLLIFAGLLLGFLVVIRLGGRWALISGSQSDDRASKTIESAVFALVAFFIAFSFNSAQTRLETRTRLHIEEANALSTAYARVDLCDASTRPKLKELFSEYTRLRIEGTRLLPDMAATKLIWKQAEQVGNQVWKESVQSTTAGGSERMLVVQAVNEMLDSATRRSRNAEVHLPWLILGALVVMSALAALLTGRSLDTSSRLADLHQWVLACTLALSLTILIDLDHPRFGLIQMQAGDEAMASVQQTIAEDLTRN